MKRKLDNCCAGTPGYRLAGSGRCTWHQARTPLPKALRRRAAGCGQRRCFAPATFVVAGILLLLPFVSHAVEKSLLILTTQAVVEQSLVLDDFVQAKEARGFRVRVATEADYGAQGMKGQERGLEIRRWLKSVKNEFTFLLIIADADYEYGEIPMFRAWPRHELPEGQCFQFDIDCRSCITDWPYAEVTGDWDLNGNGQLGETGLDDGAGGIEFNPEFHLGRIPVYFGEVGDVDAILEKTLDYMNQSGSELDYRKSILFPSAFFYFRGQEMTLDDVDGAESSEWFIANVLSEREDVDYFTMYEEEGVVTSKYKSDRPLTQENLIDEWNNGYGMVFWGGHGLEKTVVRTVWARDDNGNDRAEATEIEAPMMIESDDAYELPVDRLAFVLGQSCEIGSAEVPGNLAWSLLRYGGAIGAVASSSVTPGSGMDCADVDSELLVTTYGSDNLGIYFFRELINGTYAGSAFAQSKVELGTEPGREVYAGKMMINYFGDPSVRLYESAADVLPEGEKADAGVDEEGGGDGNCCVTAPARVRSGRGLNTVFDSVLYYIQAEISAVVRGG